MAVEDVNRNLNILSSHKLVMSINDGKCEADVVMKRFIDIIKTKDTSRFRSTVGMLGEKTIKHSLVVIICIEVPHVLTLSSPLLEYQSTSVQ